MKKNRFAFVPDEKVENVLDVLYEKASKQTLSLILHYLPKAPSYFLGRGFTSDNSKSNFFDDKYIPISPEQGNWLYLQARAINARRIVEFGTSLGISTIFLAKALKDNGGGQVIGTELVTKKVKIAQQNLKNAGLDKFVRILEGDATKTLNDIEGDIDLLLVDGFPLYALDVLKIISPKMRKGGIVVADNIKSFKKDLTPYLDYLRNPANGFLTYTLPFKDGTEFSVKI